MYAIPVIDIPSISLRYAQSALPEAPVIQDEKSWRLWVAVRSDRR